MKPETGWGPVGTTILYLYGLGIIFLSHIVWFDIPQMIIGAVWFPIAVPALVVYHMRVGNDNWIRWRVKMFGALFFPRPTDPWVANMGKLHWLFVCILAMFGMDTLRFPSESPASTASKACWIASLSLALILSILIRIFLKDWEAKYYAAVKSKGKSAQAVQRTPNADSSDLS